MGPGRSEPDGRRPAAGGAVPPAPGRPVRVVLADDHPVLRDGLRRCLEEAGLVVVGGVGDGPAAVRAAEALAPDVLLVDVSLPGLDGIEVARRVRASRPAVAVVMLSMFADRATIQQASGAGAAAYLVKDCTTDQIVEAIRAAAAGERVLSAQGSARGPAAEEGGGEHSLSRREVEVLALLAQGASTAELAAKLYISVKTVKNHLSSIYEKVDARDRTQAVLAAQRLGLARPPLPR